MVAKISVGNSLQGVLMYNGQKINEGEGKVLGSNKIFCRSDGTFDMYAALRDFESYMPQQFRTKNPVIHISLNPHPDDKLSDGQLATIAQEYMEKLGYGNQPYILYKHEDIDRYHVHIVSLRVDETGRKINDSFEHRRSKEITTELEQKYGLLPAEKQEKSETYRMKKVDPTEGNIKKQVASVVRQAMKDYRFVSFNEFRTLLSLYNIGVEEVKGEVKGKPYHGLVYTATDDKGEKVGKPLKSSLLGKYAGVDAMQKRMELSTAEIKDKRLGVETKGRVTTAMEKSHNIKQWEKELTATGVDLVLRRNDEGRIYGATFIDHNNGCVLNGSRLGKEFSANAIQQWEQNPRPSPVAATPQTQQAEQSHTYTDDGSSLGGLFDLPIEQHGYDAEEEEFRRRMKRKRKKGLKM